MNGHFINILQALDYINEGGADYQKEYKNYVEAHKERVKKFADWLKTNCPDLFEGVDLDVFDDLISEHDDSKFSEEEFEPYAQKWFGDGKKTREYSLAWEHHYMNNEHHPEYWDGEDMPYIYILEMICDWGSFSIASGDMKELSDFYYNKAKADPEKNLSDATQEIIEDILSRINSVIEREELDEWVDANRNKVSLNNSSAVSTVPTNTTPASYKNRFKKLYDYISKYFLSHIWLKQLDDHCMLFEIDHGPRGAGELQYRIEILPTTDDYEILVRAYMGYPRLRNSYKDCGWANLLRDIGNCLSINIPASNTSEYQNLLTEWVDDTGNKINRTSQVAGSSTSTKAKSQVKRYSKLLKQIDADRISTRRINIFNDTTLDLTLNTAKTHDLNLRIVYDPVDDTYDLSANGKTTLSGCDYEKDILPLLQAGGIISNTNLCE